MHMDTQAVETKRPRLAPPAAAPDIDIARGAISRSATPNRAPAVVSLEAAPALLKAAAPCPCVVTGVQKGWAATERWHDLDYFRDALPETHRSAPVLVSCSEDGRYSGTQIERQAVHMRWETFVDSLKGRQNATGGSVAQLDGLQFYLAQEPLVFGPHYSADASAAGTPNSKAPFLSKLSTDLSIPACIPWSTAGVCVNLWLAGGVTRSALHYDGYHNLLCVVRGKKTVHLYPPAETGKLKPGPVWGDAPHHAHCDPATEARKMCSMNTSGPSRLHSCKDLQGAPSVQFFVAVVGPGDSLFIPEGWWHQVDSTPGTVAANLWWLSSHGLAITSAAAGDQRYTAEMLWARQALATLVDKKRDSILAALAMKASPPASGLGNTVAEVVAMTPAELRGRLLHLAVTDPSTLREWWRTNIVLLGQKERPSTIPSCAGGVPAIAHCIRRALETQDNGEAAPGATQELALRQEAAALSALDAALDFPANSDGTESSSWATRLLEVAEAFGRGCARLVLAEMNGLSTGTWDRDSVLDNGPEQV
eukprot:SAG31_NODE_131_length_23419_cov_38.760087_6_plen_536_part_00